MGWAFFWRPQRGHSLFPAQVADSEVKAGTLQLTVERLSGALAKMEESEGALRDKVQSLTAALAQNSASLTSSQDKNLQLQKSLKACEHDRQVLQVWGCRVCLGVEPVREVVGGAGLEGLESISQREEVLGAKWEQARG